MTIDYVALILRLLHILAAITAVGGSIFIRFALLPAVEALPDNQQRDLHDRVRSRWSRLVQLSILFLLVTGLINFVIFIRATKAPEWTDWRDEYNRVYNILFGIKFLIALAIFALASILAGRSPGTQKIRDNARTWVTVNIVLALILIVISGLMRQTHVGPSVISGDGREIDVKTGG